ncbi:terminase gpA endonuclease subunit [uncultured Dysgonomonas sp.]|uniref:terminase gpA endonuclease subunit n=1 Tax=uncultured Dysgonomonas sp. TaxID=206096 RepID=UPI00260BFC6A|nr:terminase gpA endonuclease subunit [uncultured Dysgonomonas sp.]
MKGLDEIRGVKEYVSAFENLVRNSKVSISNIKPSQWAEENIVINSGAFPGRLKYSLTPYTREIIDCMAPDHPARWVAVMKGGQLGFSSTILIPGIGWMIANQPGNSYLTVGSPDLIDPAMEKVDLMIDGSGIRHLIKPSVNRNRAQKSGDTNTKKEFSKGYLTVAYAGNHKAWRQVDLMYGWFDDLEAVKSSSKESGNTIDLIEQRFAAYANRHKIYYISTPELKSTSNIEPVYLKGDQRKYLTPCPCCGEFIEWVWTIEENGITGGITWQVDENGELIAESVGYTCQKCGGFFTDEKKHQLLNQGYWQPTAKPSQPGYYSYHLSSLYAPPGIYNWERYVRRWIDIHPPGQPRDEAKYKTFVNVVLGLTYEETAEAPEANAIMGNIRDYEIGMVPESISIDDENGKIVLLTCGADMNGNRDDARLDYEIVAHAENGTIYSITHGSIGTFVKGESKKDDDRVKWTYQENMPNSVWPEFEKILEPIYKTDTGREIPIAITGLDTGHCTTDAYAFIDRTNCNIIGFKGEGEEKIKIGQDKKTIRESTERPQLYIVRVGLIKDRLAEYMNLNWGGDGTPQPGNFLNFPQPGHGLYGFRNYFEHFESEERAFEKNAIVWKKKNGKQNHLWDCRIYNMAIRDVFIDKLTKAYKQKLTFADYAALVAPYL